VDIGAKFDRFLGNIQLTDAQTADAQSKHEGVRKALRNFYYPPGYTGTISILIGSYGKNTACRPPTDVDILFIIPQHLYEQYNNPAYNGQSQLLQDVKSVLKATYPNTEMRGDGQVVVVSFSGSFSVEVIPVFKNHFADTYYTPNTHNGGSWKTTNPTAEKKNITSCNDISNGKATHMIKMSKVWKHECNVPIKSLAIELVGVEFINLWQYKDKTKIYYDWMVRDFFEYLLTKKGSIILIPGIFEFCYLDNAWESKAISVRDRAITACKYEASDKDSDNKLANLEWQKIFGNFFTG
jgi:hypothetical protein